MQERQIENSARKLIRHLKVGCKIGFPYGRRNYLRTVITEAKIEFGYKYQTRLDRQSKSLIITRIS